MKFLRAYYWSLILAVATAASLLFLGGCASMNAGGPSQPLLPQLTAEEKFSDRFQLEEEPFFFYDLFGRELLEGNEVHQYIEEKRFDATGNLVLGRTGQLDSTRYVSQLDRTVLTEDTYRGRHTEFAIGDHLKIKDKTLFPMSYIMRKTEFDGFRWDLSFQSSKHLFSLLNSRISNPINAADVAAAGTLAPTLGRRNSDAFLENKRLVGFRGQGMIGDILRVGFTYINLHKEHPQRTDNPWTGTVANTPPNQIVLTFRDDSPEDYMKGSDANGAKVAWIKYHIKTYDPAAKTWDTRIVEKGQKDFTRTLIPEENPYSKGGESDGEYWAANGFDSFQCVLDMDKEKIDPRTIQSLVIEMKVKGDYWIDVLGFSPQNKGDAKGPWPKTETGFIDMPYRDVIERPNNDKTENDKPRIVRYEYGSARGAALWGIDIEGNVPYIGFVQAQYALNPKYKQYPTISKDKIDYSQKKADNPDDPTARTFSEVDGHRFDSMYTTKDAKDELKKDSYSSSTDKAYFVNLKQRFGKFFLEESYFHVDPGWTTTYAGFGANTDRDETYKIPRTSETSDSAPYDSENYQLVEDDDDDDDFPDSDDFDGVLPRADDRNINGILDYQEDFLMFEADPPIFEQTEDLNNNRILDNLEDNYDPDYKYGADIKGYHLVGSYDILTNMTMKLGWLNSDQVSSAKQTNSKYAQLNYERDIPDFGTLLFQNRLVKVQDDIMDYAITLRVGETEPSEVRDELDFYNAMYDTTTLQLLYTGIPRLKLVTKYYLSFEKHYSPDEVDKIRKDDTSTEIDEAIDFMIMDKQLRASGDMREYAFNGQDPVLAFDQANWIPRRYKDAVVKFNTFLFKVSYEIPIGKLPVLKLLGEDMTLTPMYKWIFEKNWDRKWSERPLDPTQVSPTDYQSEEYLRFNQNTRENIGLVRLDYIFTPSLNILGGFQYRRLMNLDKNYKLNFLKPWGEDVKTPIRWRMDTKKRLWALEAINQGEWLGFNIRILVGFQRTTILPTISYTGKKKAASTSNETFVRALMGF
jgi:hypothetical protein